MRIVLIHFAIKYLGDWNAIYKALENKERISIKDLNATEAMISDEKWNVLTLLDLGYPQRLKTAYKPPFVIWYEGDLKLLAKPLQCITGNEMPPRGLAWIDESVQLISESANLVVRDFSSVDRRIATQAMTPRLFVLASGISSQIAPVDLKASDLLITEYPPQLSASKETMRARNRLIAAFAESLILISSQKQNGINQLVSEFLNLGKEVYCFPGSGAEDDGNSELIKQGANLITSVADILATSTK